MDPLTGGGSGHLTEIEIAAYIDQGLSPDEIERIEAHLALCDDCRRATSEGTALVRTVGKTRRRAIAVAGIAAALVVAVAIPQFARRSVPAESVRGGSDAQTLVAHGPIGEVPLGRLLFAWAPADRALSYRLTISAKDGSTVFTGSFSDTLATLPAGKALQAGEHYFWVADALMSDGTSRSTELREFVPVR